MAEQTYKQPPYRRDDDHGIYDDQLPASDGTKSQGVNFDKQKNLDEALGDISSAEKNPSISPKTVNDTGAKSGFYKPESNPTTNIGSGDSSFAKRTGKFLKGKGGRNILIGSGFAGFGIGGLIAFMSVISGPLQPIHLAQILGKNNDSSSSASTSRLGKLFRYARVAKAGDIGEVRVGSLGSKVFGNTISDLSKVGIEFQRNAQTGYPKSMTIDISKNPEFKGMSQQEAKIAIAKKFGVSESIITNPTGKTFQVDTDNSIKATRALSKSALTFLEDGKIISGIRFRVLADFFNTPSLFHPLKKVSASLENKFYGTKAARQASEKARAAELEKANAVKAEEARANIKDKMSGWKKFTGSALLLTAAMCMVRSVAGDVVTVNRVSIVVPSVLEAASAQAVGAQVEFGDVPSANQLGAVIENQTDSAGKTVFDAKAIKATEGTTLSGADLSQDYRQAFSGDTTAANINDGLGGGAVGGVVCSPIGQVTQGLLGIALLISGFFDAGASWGVKAASATVQVVAGAGAMMFIEQQATNLLASKALVPEIFSGPLGGNLLAYGAREAANTDIRAAGGIALSSLEAATLEKQQNLADQQEFQSKSYFARMFDTNDYRSAVSRLADSMSPSFTQNISTFIGKLADIGSLIPSVFSTLTPKVSAAGTSYDWGFPKYGIPANILNDANTEDPYDNADKVAAILDSTAGQGYIDKAGTCFGVNISKDTGQWDVTPTSPINPNDEAYVSADCSNVSDSNWKRTIMFIFDTRTMKATACFQGDDSSCDYSGFGGGSASGASTGTPTSLPTGSAQDLAKQLLPYLSSGKISCNGQASNCPDIQKTATAQSIKGGACFVDALDPQVLGILLTLAQKGHTFVLSALCTDHSSNPTSKHHYGKAADFNIIDSVFIGPNDVAWTSPKIAAASKLDQDIVSVAPASVVSFGQSQCHPPFPFFQEYTVFSDACHHQHIQVN